LMRTTDETTGPVNLGNTEEVPIRELAEMVIRLTGSRSKIAYQPLPTDDPLQRCPDLSRARQLLDYAPKVPLAEGLQRTIQDFKQRFQ
jgi:UDP-glucuronate decarboxylase